MTDIDNEALMRAMKQMQRDGKLHIIGGTAILTDAPDGTADKAFSEMGLLFAFEDQSPAYTHGFAAGMIWQRIESGEADIDLGFLEGFPLHTENLETVRRMAASRGYSVESAPTPYDGWTSVRLSLSSKPKPGLTVIEGAKP